MNARPGPVLVVLCGLPASGKSTLGRRLAADLDLPLLDKDLVRATLFATQDVDYSRCQDDFCCDVLHRTAAWLVRHGRRRGAILDGRTHLRRTQVDLVAALARRLATPLALILCRCASEVAQRRLEQDRDHPAADRTWERYLELAAAGEPIERPHLVVSTDVLGLDEQVVAAREWIARATVPL